MTKMFSNLTTDGLEEVGDRLPGSYLLDSDIYPATVKVAYVGQSRSSNAQSVTVVLEINGREHREQFWITNKDGKNYSERDSRKTPLPGYTHVDDLCLLASEMPLSEQETEEKQVLIYDYDLKKDVPTKVPCLTALTGAEVGVAILKQTVSRNEKDASGNYVPTDKTRDENVVDKFFHLESGRTVSECRAGLEEPVFAGKWLERNKGQVLDRTKKPAGTPGVPGQAPRSSGAAPAPAARSTLFGKK